MFWRTGMHFIFESGVLGMLMILASKMTILGLKTNTSGTFFRPDRKDSLARPKSNQIHNPPIQKNPDSSCARPSIISIYHLEYC